MAGRRRSKPRTPSFIVPPMQAALGPSMGLLFECEACGSPSVELPREFKDNAGVHCRRCGAQLGTWGAFKDKTKDLILAERAESGQRPKGAYSVDPLPDL